MPLHKRKTLSLLIITMVICISTCVYYGARRVVDITVNKNKTLSTIPTLFRRIIKTQVRDSIENITTTTSQHHSPYITFKYKGTTFFVTCLCKFDGTLQNAIHTHNFTNKNYIATMMMVVNLNNLNIEIKEHETINKIDSVSLYTNSKKYDIINNTTNQYHIHLYTKNLIIRFNNNNIDELIAYSNNPSTSSDIHAILLQDNGYIFIIIADSQNPDITNQHLKEIITSPDSSLSKSN